MAASTGSGKTLAFYLPALAWLSAERKAQAHSRGVRVLALYPQRVAQDQLAEVYSQRKFDDELGRVSTTLNVGVLLAIRHHRAQDRVAVAQDAVFARSSVVKMQRRTAIAERPGRRG